MFQQSTSVVIFRQDTSIISLLTQVPWPLRTGSSTNTRWLLFASNNIPSFTSTAFKYHASYLYLEISVSVFLFSPRQTSLIISTFHCLAFFHIYRDKHVHVHCHLLLTFETNLLSLLCTNSPPLLKIHSLFGKNPRRTVHLLTAAGRHCCCMGVCRVLCTSLASTPVSMITKGLGDSFNRFYLLGLSKRRKLPRLWSFSYYKKTLRHYIFISRQ